MTATIVDISNIYSPPSDKQKEIPMVSIGMPVYNAENYLREALDSIICQTFTDFELIISDNGSTDSTAAICREYAKRDNRIIYHRNIKNLGAAWNFNRVVELARGKYFRWMSHDDICSPTCFEECVNVLEERPDVILCYSDTPLIDADGHNIRTIAADPKLESASAFIRFGQSWRYPSQVIVFGMVRMSEFKHTGLLGNFSSSDRVLAGQLALRGKLHGVHKDLFLYRSHSEQSTGSKYPTRKVRAAWFDPNNKNTITFPHWRLLLEFSKSIWNAPTTLLEKVYCYGSMVRWMIRNRKKLFSNLILKG